MTQEQALAAAQQQHPNFKITVERDRSIGAREHNTYYVWDYSPSNPRIIGSSYESWEAALAEAKVNHGEGETAEDVPFEDEKVNEVEG